jgi:hypothetical protein
MRYMTCLKTTSAALIVAWACVAGSASADKNTDGVMTREKYERYVQLFNAADHRYADYYDENVVFDARPAPQPLHGRKAILDMYDVLRKQLLEELTVGAVVIDNAQGLMAVELTNRITALTDNVKLPSRTLNKGDVTVGSGVIFYELSNGKITRIREAVSGRTFTPAKK